MLRVAFLVDGFNLYYSILDIRSNLHGTILKWLDLRGLCLSYLELIGRGTMLQSVHYFSALKKHRLGSDPDIVARHMNYVDALQAHGVNVELAQFKRKDMFCPHCGANFVRFEEKETDVAIAAKLFELLIGNACDAIVLMGGDTDLMPAIRTAQRLFPRVAIWVGFPYGRFNIELHNLVAPNSFRIKPKRYLGNQFPDPLVLPDGRILTKPATW